MTFPPTSQIRVVPLLIAAFSILLPQMASAGAWTLGKGHVWSKITYMSLSTDEHYDNDGKAQTIPARYKSKQVYFDLRYGVTDQIDLGLLVPYISNEFVDVSPEHPFYGEPDKKDSGLGDLRGFAKVNLLNRAGRVGTLRFGFKAPMGDYREVPEALSITGGQWDFDIAAQIGGSFHPVPMYSNVDFGYRWRGKYEDDDTEPVDRSYTPGGEFFFNVELGYSPMDKFLVALKGEGFIGAEYDAINNPGNEEQLSQSVSYVVPTVLVAVTPNWSVEGAVRMALAGKRYFAGPTYAVGLSYSGNMLGKAIDQATLSSM